MHGPGGFAGAELATSAAEGAPPREVARRTLEGGMAGILAGPAAELVFGMPGAIRGVSAAGRSARAATAAENAALAEAQAGVTHARRAQARVADLRAVIQTREAQMRADLGANLEALLAGRVQARSVAQAAIDASSRRALEPATLTAPEVGTARPFTVEPAVRDVGPPLVSERGVPGEQSRFNPTPYVNPWADPHLVWKTLGRQRLIGTGMLAGGAYLSQSDNEALRKTGILMLPWAVASLVGMRNFRAAGRAVGVPIRDALARTETGRALIDLIDPEVLLTPELRARLHTWELRQAQSRAQSAELAAEAARLGPVGNRVISDAIEAEAWERAAITPDVAEQALATAAKMVDNLTRTGSEQVQLGTLSAAAEARYRGRYLPRIYAEHLATEAGGTGRPGAPRIRSYHQRQRLSPERRVELGEIRESSMRYQRAMAQAEGNINAAKLFAAIREIPGAIHPDAGTLTDNLLAASQLRNEAYAALKSARGAARRTALAEYRAAGKEVAAARRALDAFRRDFNPTRGEWAVLPDTKELGPLRNAVVQRELAMALNGYRELPGGVGSLYRYWKKLRTVYNIGTHTANTISNISLAHMAGLPFWEQATELAGAIRDLRSYGPRTKALAEADVLGHGLSAITEDAAALVGGSLRSQLRMLAGTTRPETARVLAERGIKPYTQLGGLAHRADQFTTRLYNNEDNIFRVMLYGKAVRPVSEGGMGMAPEVAAEYVRERLVNYRSRSPLVYAMRNSVFPFIIYPIKAIPVLAKGLIEHPERWLTLMAIWGAVDQYSRHVVGRPAHDAQPPGQREGGRFGYFVPTSIQLPIRGRGGKRYFADLSRWTPLAALTTGAPPGTTLGQIHENVPGLLQPSGPLVDITARGILNRDPFTGDPWFGRSDTPVERVGKVAGAAAQLALPPALGFHVPRIVEELRNRDPETARMQALGLFGLRPRVTRPGAYEEHVHAALQRELEEITTRYGRLIREAERNPSRVRQLAAEESRKIEAAYRRYDEAIQ
jgi:hypothetical protein